MWNYFFKCVSQAELKEKPLFNLLSWNANMLHLVKVYLWREDI